MMLGVCPQAGTYDVAGRRPPVRLASSTARIAVKKMPSNVPAPPEPCDLTEIEQVGSDQRAEAAGDVRFCANSRHSAALAAAQTS